MLRAGQGAATLVPGSRLDEVGAQAGDVVAHPPAPSRRRMVAKPRETRWRTAASDMRISPASSG